MDHCLTIGFNFLAGGHVLYSLTDTLSLIRKTNGHSQHRQIAAFIKKRGCQFGSQAILPYLTVAGTVEWLKFVVTPLDYTETVHMLSCANHFNDHFEQFSSRVMIQIDKMPLSIDD